MNIEIINQSNVDIAWPLIAKRFTDYLKTPPTDISSGDFWTMCRSGQAFLIIAHDDTIKAASIWRFEGTAFNCLLLAGEKPEFWVFELMNFCRELARNNGATRLIATGRIGFGKILKAYEKQVRITHQTYLIEV